jgi:hypothetical protein
MESQREKLELLSEKWKLQKGYNNFVYDGILNYEKWNSLTLKILFLLKETADDFTKIADQEINITKGNGSHFWWNICYWKYLIENLSKGVNADFVSQSELPEVKINNNILDSIAYVNVKKNCENKPASNDSEIYQYAINDKELLVEQIELINPDVVFCSKVTFLAYRYVYDNEIEKINSICYKHKNRLILNFRHPSYFQISGGRETLFNNLKIALTADGNLFGHFPWAIK